VHALQGGEQGLELMIDERLHLSSHPPPDPALRGGWRQRLQRAAARDAEGVLSHILLQAPPTLHWEPRKYTSRGVMLVTQTFPLI
jgi:hypothetical protein